MAGDDSLSPVRGQIVYVDQPGLTEWLIAEDAADEVTYVVPRKHDVVVGGTSQEGDWNLNADPATAERMLARAVALIPPLAKAEIIGHRVGLRPARSSIRCEATDLGGRRVVHCYGHGGAGVTVSWGCADEVLALVSG
jgi:D-amino-acid oxidase